MDDRDFAAEPDGKVVTVNGERDLERGRHLTEKRKEEIRASAKGLLFVDGVLHRPARLPGILAKISYHLGGMDQIRVGLGSADESTGAHGMEFAIDDLDSALAWARDRNEMEGEYAVTHCELEVEIHHPELVPPTDVIQREATRICRFLLDAHGRDLSQMDDDFIDAWQTCRRCQKETEGRRSEEAVAELLDSWERLYEVHAVEEDLRRRRYGSSYNLSDDVHYKAFAGLRRRWDERPILVDGFQPAP